MDKNSRKIEDDDKDLKEAYNQIVNNEKTFDLEKLLLKIVKNQEAIIEILNQNNRRPYPL